MTVRELFERLKDMPDHAQVLLSVPPPGDDYYHLDKLELDGDELVLISDPE